MNLDGIRGRIYLGLMSGGARHQKFVGVRVLAQSGRTRDQTGIKAEGNQDLKQANECGMTCETGWMLMSWDLPREEHITVVAGFRLNSVREVEDEDRSVAVKMRSRLVYLAILFIGTVKT